MAESEHPPFVSIKFDPVGRVHRFLLPEVGFKPPLQSGDAVVVARDGRKAFGTVARAVPALAQRAPPPPQSNVVLRRASGDDINARLTQRHREREIRRIAALKIKECGLSMKLVRVEQQYDGSRLTFYFTADERVDFRALVRELASEFRCRIEMRQIGARDEAKLLGGYGTCGRPAMLHDLAQGIRAGVDQDGQAAASQPQSVHGCPACAGRLKMLPAV